MLIRTERSDDGRWFAAIKVGTSQIAAAQGYTESSAIDRAFDALDKKQRKEETNEAHTHNTRRLLGHRRSSDN